MVRYLLSQLLSFSSQNRILELTNNLSTQVPNSSSHTETSDSSVVSHDELDSLSGSDGNCSDSNGDDPSSPHRRNVSPNDSYSLQRLIDELKSINCKSQLNELILKLQEIHIDLSPFTELLSIEMAWCWTILLSIL